MLIVVSSLAGQSFPPLRHVFRIGVGRVVMSGATLLAPKSVEFPLLPQASRVVAADGSELAWFSAPGSTRPVRLRDVPRHVRRAVLAAEDANFYSHAGIDPQAWVRVAAHRLTRGRSEGGSTISQQLAKINFAGSDRTLSRKFSELTYAASLERRYSKDELLERYLNQVPFGDGSYGIGAAAFTYFGQSPARLTVAQAALLAGKIQSPSRLDPWRAPLAMLMRRNHVLRLMARRGWLRGPLLEDALASPLGILAEPARSPWTHSAPHFVDYVRRAAVQIAALGTLPAARTEALYTGGYTIETTLDPRMFRAAEMVARRIAVTTPPRAVTVVITAVRPSDGAIRTLFGGLDPNLRFDIASQGRLDPGEILGPFAALIQQRPGSSDPVPTAGVVPTDREAMIRLLNRIGIRSATCRFTTDGVPGEVSPLDVAAGYATLAAGGIHTHPYAITRILDRNGKIVYRHVPSARTALGSEVRSARSRLVRLDRGTGSRVSGAASASSAGREGWAAGVGRGLATVTWVGRAEGTDGGTARPPKAPSRLAVRALREFLTPRRDAPDGLSTTLVASRSSHVLSPARMAGAMDVAVLEKQIRTALRSAATSAGAAVTIEGLGSVIDVNATREFAPGSTQKIYTGAAALLELGSERRLVTEVRRTGHVRGDGRLEGDLILVGTGDPALSGTDLSTLAAAVAGSGVRRVTGNLYADDTRYDRATAGTGWKPGFMPIHSPPLSAIAVDRNRWRCDTAYTADPASANAKRLGAALSRRGVTIEGGTQLGAPAARSYLVAMHRSPPIADLVRDMLKKSDSFAAELLLKELGRSVGQPTSAGGLQVVRVWAHRFGMSPHRSVDASGLSVLDAVTPRHEMQWLLNIGRTRVAELFRRSLPVGCEGGTLRFRFCGTPGAGKVFAKTGTLHNTVALAGYTTTASGRQVGFSFMLEGLRSKTEAKAAIDRAVLALVAYRG